MKKGLKILCFGLATCAIVPGVILGVGCGAGEPEAKDGISVSTSFINDYYQGQDLDVTGGVLAYTKDGETVDVNITSDMISNFDSSKVGSGSMTITYEGFTTTVNYTVKETGLVGKVFSDIAYYTELGQSIEHNVVFFPTYDTIFMYASSGFNKYTVSYKPVVDDGKLTIVATATLSTWSGEFLVEHIFSNMTETGFDMRLNYYWAEDSDYTGAHAGDFDTFVESEFLPATNEAFPDAEEGLYVIVKPNKTEYKAGEKLDVSGCYILSIKGEDWITTALTEDMVKSFSTGGNNYDTPLDMLISYNGQRTTTQYTITK